MTTYSQAHYSHIHDDRNEKEKEEQHRIVQSIVENNFKTLKIELTPKKAVRYEPRQRSRVDLGSGWYCYITDNQLQNSQVVLTLHGAPGDHVEWAGLQTEMNKQYRWINLTVPGFDGEDQRRGNYDGSCLHLSQMIIKLMQHLSIPKIILCAHSLGSIFSSYFITYHPQYVRGYINITGIVDQWYVGLLTFFRAAVAEFGYNSQEWRDKKYYDDDNCRAILHNLFLKTIQGKYFGHVQFPRLKKTEYCAYLKLFNSTPHGLSQLYNMNRKLELLRVLIFGKKDPLHAWHTTEESIYNLCRTQESYINQPKYRKLFQNAQQKIEKKLKEKFNIEINALKLQEYFCFHLPDTGHNAHKRRPKQISRIIKIYITCLEILEEYSSVNESKL